MQPMEALPVMNGLETTRLLADSIDQTHDTPPLPFGSADWPAAYAARSQRVEHQKFMLV